MFLPGIRKRIHGFNSSKHCGGVEIEMNDVMFLPVSGCFYTSNLPYYIISITKHNFGWNYMVCSLFRHIVRIIIIIYCMELFFHPCVVHFEKLSMVHFSIPSRILCRCSLRLKITSGRDGVWFYEHDLRIEITWK